MNGNLVSRPRAAIATALVIVVAVAITAALFPNGNGTGIPDFPTHGREEAHGRIFVATDATERGNPHELSPNPPTFTFTLGEWVDIFTGCNYISGRWKLTDARLELSDGGITMIACSELPDVDGWMSTFLEHRPRWRLEGNTLELSSGFGTMTLVDKGAGRDRDDIMGGEYVSTAIWERPEDLDSSRFSPSVWPRLSISRQGHVRAGFGCGVLEADAQIADGWLVIPDWINERTQPCSGSMKAHNTDWFWDFLRQPVRWQSIENGLWLASGSTTLTFEAARDGMHRNDPDVLVERPSARPAWMVAATSGSGS